MDIIGYIETQVALNTSQQYFFATIVFVLAILTLRIFKFFIIHRIRSMAQKTKTLFDDMLVEMVDSLSWSFLSFLAFYCAIKFVILPQIVNTILWYMLILFLFFYGLKAIFKGIDFFVQKELKKRENLENSSFLGIIGMISKGLIFVIAFKHVSFGNSFKHHSTFIIVFFF